MSILQERCQFLSFENDLLNEKLSEIPKCHQKGKSEGSRIQFELEEKLSKSNADLTKSVERNSKLERDLVQIKVEPEKALKWTTFSHVLENITCKKFNNRRGLGF